MIAGLVLNIVSITGVCVNLLPCGDLVSLSFFGLYNHGSSLYSNLHNLGYKNAAELSKFSEFFLKFMLIFICCIWFTYFSRMSVFMINAKRFGLNSRALFFFMMLMAPGFFYVSVLAFGEVDVADGFSEKYINNNELSNGYFYLMSFKYWFVFLGNILLVIPFLGKILFTFFPRTQKG